MDEIVFKVLENSKVVNKTIYIAVGLRKDGFKEVLGMWLGKSESAAYRMSVLTDMRARGVEDILITATDNLNGFTQTIRTVFPQSSIQICVVHQIRNSCRYVVWKDKKGVTLDMKDIILPVRPFRLPWRALKPNGAVNMLCNQKLEGQLGRTGRFL